MISLSSVKKAMFASVAAGCLGAFAVPECASADLLHRWSFNGNLEDSVGGLTATLTGSTSWNNADNPTAVKLAGGAHNASYINLGTGIVPATSTPITFEIWATQHSVRNWSRIFDFGVGDEKSYILMSWTQGTTLTQDAVEIKDGGTTILRTDHAMQPYSLNVPYHISLTITPTGDGKVTLAYAKRSVTTGEVLASGSKTTSANWDPSKMAGWTYCCLGRSQYTGDNDANASYDEMRIWKAALTPEQLTYSARLGPDALPTSAPGPVTLTLTSEEGTVSVDGAAGVGSGTVALSSANDAVLVATPVSGRNFVRWTGDTDRIIAGTPESATVTISTARGNVSLTAVYESNTEAVYARIENNQFKYLTSTKNPAVPPEGGMNSGVTILFSSDAEYQQLKGQAAEVAKANALELESNITLSADTDWTELDYSLAGNAIDINGKHFTTGSLTGGGGIYSSGNNVANGGFEEDVIPNGAYVAMTPKGWKTSGSVYLLKNNRDHGDSEMNSSNWCVVWNGAYIFREFAVASAGDYTFQFTVASRNNAQWTNSGVYAGVDDKWVINERTGSWKAATKTFTIPLQVGIHTIKIGCNANAAILVDNVSLYKGSNAATTGILEVKVPEGRTVTNNDVLLGGGNALQLWKSGAGELVMNKVNNGFGSPFGKVSTVVKEGMLRKSHNGATCGVQYSTIQVDDGGAFDLNGRAYWDYYYTLNGHGPDGKGSLVNTTAESSPWEPGNYGYLRDVNIGSDTTISGTQSFGMSFWQHGATTMTMNDHTVHYGGTLIYFGNQTYVGKGRIVIDQGCTMEAYNNAPSAPGCTLVVEGQLQQHDKALGVVSNLIFTATGTFCNAWDSRPAFTVSDTYAPNLAAPSVSKVLHPTLTLGTATSPNTCLDLSLFTDAFNASSTTFYPGSLVKVELGARTVADNQKIVSWSALPNAAGFVGSGENLGGMSLIARDDGLYAISSPAWAEWDLVNECWNFFTSVGEPYPTAWEDGVTENMEVHFSSLAEFDAIKTQEVSPARFVLTKLELAPGAALYDFSNGFEFVVKSGLVIDLKGNQLKLPGSLCGGTIPFTVTDTGATLPPAITSSSCFWLDAFDKSTMTLDANNKVLTWTSKDANHVVATATSAPTYNATGYGRPTVDFGGVGSGLDMSYPRFSNLRTVFWVIKIAKSECAFLLGDTDNYNFHRGAAGQYGNNSYHKFSNIWNGLTPVNIGADVIPDGDFQVISAVMKEDSRSNLLTSDRLCLSSKVARSGGRQLCELICFSSPLGDADRTAITQYLQQKWFLNGQQGQLIVDVPEGKTVVNNNITIAGSAKLVKAGAGTLTANRAGQPYVGGTLVADGQLTLGNNTCLGGKSEVTVDSGATLEANGKGDIYNYSYVLNGGTFQNTAADVGSGIAQIASMRLTADSTFKPTCNYGFIGSGYAATRLDLGGHKLTVPVGIGKSFWLFNATVTAGTIDLTTGGWLVVDKTAVNAPEAYFKVGCALDIRVPFAVGGYEAVYGADYNDYAGVMTVNGVFKPVSGFYRGVTLANGATLDLSAFNGILGRETTFKDDKTPIVYPTGTEEEPAQLWIELHGRALTSSKIIDWAAIPSNLTVQVTERTARDGRRATLKGDGVYIIGGTVLFFR